MNTFRTRGMAVPLLLTIILVAAALGGAFYYLLSNPRPMDPGGLGAGSERLT